MFHLSSSASDAMVIALYFTYLYSLAGELEAFSSWIFCNLNSQFHLEEVLVSNLHFEWCQHFSYVTYYGHYVEYYQDWEEMLNHKSLLSAQYASIYQRL
jgi:hypothetical protein